MRGWHGLVSKGHMALADRGSSALGAARKGVVDRGGCFIWTYTSGHARKKENVLVSLSLRNLYPRQGGQGAVNGLLGPHLSTCPAAVGDEGFSCNTCGTGGQLMTSRIP